MASWPLISDFARMLKNPGMGFHNPDLKDCTVEMNHLGQPKARSGNFATVYRGYRQDGSEFAIRVFNRRQDERLENYHAVSDYLENRPVSSIVKFDYDERGIRSAGDGKFYPLLTMEWVPGITLFEWTRDRSREGYDEALEIAAEVWLHLVGELTDNEIVHGDLQHGNVMVSPQGHFKLVDYDCMCVPKLVGRRNLETGMVPYQHPGRNAETRLFMGMDNYSSLMIYVALRALAAKPELWVTYVDQPEYDKILFRAEDFERPASSPLYHELLNSPDEQVRDLSHYLFELYRYQLEDIPPVDEVLLWCESIENLISEREWGKVVQLVQRMGPGEQIAPDLQPYVQEAQRRVACKQGIEQALAEGNEERVEQLYATGLLQDYPEAEHLIEPASLAAQVRPVLRLLASAMQLRAYGKLKEIWLANQQLLTGRASARTYEAEVQKLLIVDRIRAILAQQPIDARALMEAWEHLQKLGGHPSAEPFRPHVEQQATLRNSMGQLQELLLKAPSSPTLSHDKKIAAAASPELMHGVDPASPLVQQYQAAMKRLAYVKKVHQVEKAGTVESESYIATVFKHLPKAYHDGLARRSQQARKRLVAYRELKRALQEPCSELDLVTAWKALGDVKGRVMVSDEERARVEIAAARAPLLRALSEIPEDADEAEQERLVLQIWNETLLEDCADAAPWAYIYKRVSAGRQTLAAIEQAVEDRNLQEAERLMALPCMEGHVLPDATAQSLEDMRAESQQQRAVKRQAIVGCLSNNDRAAFRELFDPLLVGEICEQFRHHQPVISQWIESEILPLPLLGLACDPETALARDEDGNLHVLWNWPEAASECKVVVSKKRPPAHSIPDDLESLHAVALDRLNWRPELGYQVALDPEWEGAHVYVWAVIDLRFQLFYSDPLDLGEIKAEEKQPAKRWGLFRSWRAAKAAKEAAGEGEAEVAEKEGIDDHSDQEGDVPDIEAEGDGTSGTVP